MRKSDLRRVIQEELRLLREAKSPDVITSKYIAAHGKNPSGKGNWAFMITNDARGRDGEIVWPNSGVAIDYSKALKMASDEAQDLGMQYVIVMP